MEKLVFSIEKLDGILYFLFIHKNTKVYFNRIPAIWFDGYESSPKVLVTRKNKEFDKGYIKYFGTHGSSEYFFGLNKIITKEKQLDYSPTSHDMESSYFKEGDLLQIESKKTASVFLHELLGWISLPGDKEKCKKESELSIKKFFEIGEKHNGNEKVIQMLRTRESRKEQKMSWAEVERRKKLKVVIGTT